MKSLFFKIIIIFLLATKVGCGSGVVVTKQSLPELYPVMEIKNILDSVIEHDRCFESDTKTVNAGQILLRFNLRYDKLNLSTESSSQLPLADFFNANSIETFTLYGGFMYENYEVYVAVRNGKSRLKNYFQKTSKTFEIGAVTDEMPQFYCSKAYESKKGKFRLRDDHRSWIIN
jgi:hypothetical protein